MARASNGASRTHAAPFLDEMRSINRLYEQYAKAAGLTQIALTILEIIYATPDGCTQKYIGERTGLSKQNVNAVIRGFWKKGYIELREMDADRRNKEICLSEAGRRVAGDVLNGLIAAEEAAMGCLTKEQREQLTSLMKTIALGFAESFGRL